LIVQHNFFRKKVMSTLLQRKRSAALGEAELMEEIDPAKLLLSLENLGEVNVVNVPEDIKAEARLALDRRWALKLSTMNELGR
jgi:quinolinate synthase